MYDTAALTQTSPTEVNIDYKKGGKLAMNAKAAVAKDGKTMTRHLHRHGREGTGVHQRRCLHEVVSAYESGRGHSTGTVTVECPRRSPSRDAAVAGVDSHDPDTLLPRAIAGHD